jgi:hypothetical protein
VIYKAEIVEQRGLSKAKMFQVGSSNSCTREFDRRMVRRGDHM